MKRSAELTPEQSESIRKQLAAGVDLKSIVVTRTKERRRSDGPNKGEAAFGQHLEFEKQQGRILWYWFEQIKLKIGKKCWLTIDYFVVRSDWRIELIDVKGRKGDGYYCREDAKVKLRSIADKFPVFKVVVVWPRKGGGWNREDFS